MSNTKFFNDAIAEAKAIRETALANAKLALEEAFTPQIQSMLEKKLQQEADDMDEAKDLDEASVEEAKKDMDEAKKDVDEAKKDMDEAKSDVDEAKDMDEAKKDVDEAKKDVDEAKSDVDEAKKDVDEAKKDVDEAKADVDEAKVDEKKDMDEASQVEEASVEESAVEEAAVEEASDMEEGSIEEIDLDELLAELEAAEGQVSEETVEETAPVAETEIEEEAPVVEAEADDEVGEITVDELKDIIKDVMADVLGGGGAEDGEDMEVDVDGDGDMDVAIDADEDGDIEIDEKKDMEEGVMDKLISAFDKVTGIDKFSACMAEDWASPACKKLKDEISLKASTAIDPIKGGDMFEKKEVEEVKAELNEAVNVITTLKSELNEVNLLNAKLLYVNKLFRSKTLTEAQKVKVINAFDRAESVKEVKNIFETIKDTTTKAKTTVNESRSFASKAAGVAETKQPIVESNDFVARMQKLAGII